MNEQKFMMINLNILSPETLIGLAKDHLKFVSAAGELLPPSKSHEYKAIFHALREHLDELKGKDWTDKHLPVSDWSVI